MASYGEISREEKKLNYLAKIMEDLHDIALSLRVMSGRSKVTRVGEDKKQTYTQKYFARSTESSTVNDE